jgi:hypothetical protein
MTSYQGQSKAVAWTKAVAYCQGGECAEVSQRDGEILVRSSRSPAEVIRLTPAEWSAFTAGITAGEFRNFG